MTDLINFFTSNDNTIIIGLMTVIVVLMIIILILDLKTKHQEQLEKNDFNLNIDPNDSNEDSQVIDSNQIKEIKYVESNAELEKTKAKLELETLKAELQKAELKNMQETKEEVKPINTSTNDASEALDQISKFEDEQEEKAIISVEELTKKADELYDQNEITQYQDEGNEPISIQELEALYQTSTTNITNEKQAPVSNVKMEENFTLKANEKKVNTKFTSTPFISPVYGINEIEERDNSLDNVNLEQTANLEKLNEELKKVNEFLVTLKELRNKLQ